MSKKIILVEESLKDFSNRDGELGKMRNIYLTENEEEEDLPEVEDIDPDYEEDSEEVDLDNPDDIEIFDKVDVSDMDDEDDVLVDEDESEQLKLQLRNELLKREPDREPFEFSIKQNPDESIVAIPMAELRNGDLFIFKVKGVPELQKIFVKDII